MGSWMGMGMGMGSGLVVTVAVDVDVCVGVIWAGGGGAGLDGGMLREHRLGDNGQFQAYVDKTSRKIEKAYAKFVKSGAKGAGKNGGKGKGKGKVDKTAQVAVTTPVGKYTIDFNDMTQTGTKSKGTRPVRRSTPEGRARARRAPPVAVRGRRRGRGRPMLPIQPRIDPHFYNGPRRACGSGRILSGRASTPRSSLKFRARSSRRTRRFFAPGPGPARARARARARQAAARLHSPSRAPSTASTLSTWSSTGLAIRVSRGRFGGCGPEPRSHRRHPARRPLAAAAARWARSAASGCVARRYPTRPSSTPGHGRRTGAGRTRSARQSTRRSRSSKTRSLRADTKSGSRPRQPRRTPRRSQRRSRSSSRLVASGTASRSRRWSRAKSRIRPRSVQSGGSAARIRTCGRHPTRRPARRGRTRRRTPARHTRAPEEN
ncbi:uncharacterized protein AMSG_05890 [Thecamonas trahens ATCC 50062]|uniref:WWE domain-containing protein n=1 Tax=Thecamonas trahens ATCC 50062 TaxID=461836 RepID=A0A0L0DCR6_THETB|nr:hypothetical protein AMSG_05890 [Thecamonas trahens ATCC 50062]KNC50117.1 hypothetical protein AMSG_05890 [Thecamonas trahens ATCC 50062]|eukprot:XP_013757276.1 hypothetical protein AMSG_05890 [Thecamonas trahens ATCC 50062]